MDKSFKYAAFSKWFRSGQQVIASNDAITALYNTLGPISEAQTE